MKIWKQITFTCILVIIVIIAAACNRGSGAASTGARPQAQPQAQTAGRTSAAEAGSASVSHEEIAGSPELLVTGNSHTEVNPILIWGWSRDGKIGISELSDSGGRGGTIIKTFVFDAVNDTVLWESNIDSFDYGDGYSGIPEKEITSFFNNFHNRCRQQFGIEVNEVRPAAPSGTVIRHNGRSFDIAVNSLEEEDGMIRRYSAVAKTGGRSKTILSKDTFLPTLPKFSWYSINPFEERA